MKILPSRVLAGATAAALSAVFLVAVPAQATPALTTVVINDYTFTYEAGNAAAGCAITAWAGTATDELLPSGFSTSGVYYPLTAIGESAFQQKDLTSVTIPSTVTSIGLGAFLLNSLTSLSIPASVTSVGDYAFAHNLLTSVTIPGTVTDLGEWVFMNNSLTSFTFAPGVTTIPQGTFAYNQLTSITIPASVTDIGAWAFADNPLDSVLMMGPHPTSLGGTAFGTDGAPTPVVSYYARNAGYTSPTWVAGGSTYTSRALVTVTWYDGRGGSTTTSDEVASAVAAPTAPTAEAHRFLGWTVADGDGPALAFPATLAGDTILYSLWEARAVTSPAAAPAGSSFSVSGSGFEPGETVEVSLTPDAALLATLTASGTGTISATVAVDSATPTGWHELVFTGSITGATSYALTVDAAPLPTTTIGGVTFTVNPADPTAGATVTSYVAPIDGGTDLVIPSSVTVDGVTYPVTVIGVGAFASAGLTSVTIPESVVTIGDYAFRGNSLTSVTIPASVTTLGYQAFDNNPLDSVLMEGPVPTSIANWVFGEPSTVFMVSYYARFAGYTEPMWTAGNQSYPSRALVAATFDAGIGTGGTTTDTVAGADVVAPTPPTAVGHHFLGWTLIDGSGPAITFPVTLAADQTLYALWETRAVTAPAKAGAGDSIAITGSGFEPGETVEVWLHSDPVLLSTLTASGTGTISANLLLAPATPFGAHQLVFTGTATGTTANDILVEGVLAASGFDAQALGLIALALALAGGGLIAASRRIAVAGTAAHGARHDRGGHQHR
jgi:hypothetical protein